MAGLQYDLHRLRLLYELRHRGTLTAVAEALAYSPSAISQQLARLESEVGTPLTERDGRRVRLTAQGMILAAHTEIVLRQLEEAGAQVARSLGEVAGTLRLAVFQTAMLTVVPEMLSRLRSVHPALRIEVDQAEPRVELRPLLPKDFDLVIDEVYPGHPLPQVVGHYQELLIEDPLRLAVCKDDEHGDQSGDIRAYAESPWAMEPPGSPARAWTMAACRNAGFEPDVRYDSSDMLVHEHLVECGHAVAFLPDLMWLNRSPSVRLHRISPAHYRSVVITCLDGARTHPKIEAARKALLFALRDAGTLSPE